MKKDSKGPCWILSHERCGITESIFVTEDELVELRERLSDMYLPGDLFRVVENGTGESFGGLLRKYDHEMIMAFDEAEKDYKGEIEKMFRDVIESRYIIDNI